MQAAGMRAGAVNTIRRIAATKNTKKTKVGDYKEATKQSPTIDEAGMRGQAQREWPRKGTKSEYCFDWPCVASIDAIKPDDLPN
jgi:hypothetical protein